MSILKTRLYKPVLKVHYVTRKKILDYLDRRGDNSLNLIVAPAGYGKSVTISQWLDRKGSKYGWISLDNDFNDLRTFLDYLITCIRVTYPTSLTNVQRLCNVMDLPSVKVISNMLINELTELKEEFILVLDDYHLINNQQIHDLFNEILKYHSENLKLVILSRRDLPLILSSLKAYDRVNEIRMSELSFDAFEVIDLSNKISNKPINFESASELVAFTEGWIVGLRLAIQSIDQGQDLKQIVSTVGSEKQAMTQFLMDEILKPQSQNVRECLYRASILNRFCEDLLCTLCFSNETLDKSINETADDFFTQITNETLFIIPLDSEQIWYRLHHLFSEILQKQLEKRYSHEQISTFHQKASRWFEHNGYFDEAIEHAVNAGDLDFANQIIENQCQELFDHEKLFLMDRWLKMLPIEAIDSYLVPKLIQAFLYDTSQDYFMMEQSLNKAYTLLKSPSSKDHQNNLKWGYFYSLQSILFYKTGKIQESLQSSASSIELLDSDSSLLKDAALLYNSFGLIASGKGVEAEKKVLHYRSFVQSNDQLGLARNSLVLSYVSFFSGNLQRIYNALYPIIDFYKGKSFNITSSMVYYYYGFVNYQWNNLDDAASLFNYIWDNRFSGMPRWVLHHLYMQVLTLKAKGEKAKMYDLLDNAHQYVNELKSPSFDQFLACMEVEIALAENDLERVEKYRHKADYYLLPPYCFYFVPQLTSVKLILIEGGVENFQKAQTELSEIVEYLHKTSNKNLLIQAVLMQALLLKLIGDLDGALTNLSEAINMARPGGFIRVFLDIGEEIRDLILLHQNENKDDPFLSKILKAFVHEKSSPIYKSNNANGLGNNPSGLHSNNLSVRDIEILRLAALGFQNKEIAEKLFLSTNSIKKYLYYIYQKLNVKNRVNAIDKVRQLNLI